ncbi:MAG: C13 family peptidase [Hyphomicrobiaceae bacterium]
MRIGFYGMSVAAAGMIAAVLLWQPAVAEKHRSRADIEATSARQAELVDRALAPLEPAPADRAHLYFVGFAGYGPEAVFKREVLAAQRLFDERFGTKGRSIVLINHESTLDSTPLANVANLERVLHHVGKLMADGSSTLFLFLTSHGLKRVFVVEMPGFGFVHLTPNRLKDLLDRSGIKNRVIVVSACYSGSFIRELADPSTLVITAARADRTSFGCEDKRQWTYFGDAFFNRALRQERSFEKAFHRAKRLIRTWEEKERLTPSLPQIAGGQQLRSRLETFATGH